MLIQASSIRGGFSLGVLLIAIGAGIPTSSSSQTIQGSFVDRDSRSPLPGTLILLLDADGQELSTHLTNEQGQFRIRTPGPGTFLVRAERIGYGTVLSGPIALSRNQTERLQLVGHMMPISLEGIRVGGDRRCRVRPKEGVAVAALWEEARKALRIQTWTAQHTIRPFEVLRYQRLLDSWGRVERTVFEERRTLMASTAIRSKSPGELQTEGFVVRVPGAFNTFEYYGPDADVLLSDEFLDSHCFKLSPDPGPAGEIGLSFQPIPGRRIPDIHGTFWLDVSTGRLKQLEYEYTWAPRSEVGGFGRGRVDFEALPNGTWIVAKWWIRTPRIEVELGGGAMDTGRLVGFLEEGELVTKSPSAYRQAQASYRGTVTGTVWDSTAGAPLPDAMVFLSGTQFSSMTDSFGAFHIEGPREGVGRLAFAHPKLDSLVFYPSIVPVVISAGETTQANLALPSWNTILVHLCGRDKELDGDAAIVGTVSEAGSEVPVPDMPVLLSWSEDPADTQNPPSLPAIRTETTTDQKGRFLACGIPAHTVIHVRAGQPQGFGVETTIEVSPGQVAILSLELGGPTE